MKKIKRATDKMESVEDEDKNKCHICMETFEDPGEVLPLLCSDNHRFCKKCIYEWYCVGIRQNHYVPNDKVYACPICRQYGGFRVLKDMFPEIYHLNCINYQEFSMFKCFCRHNEASYGDSYYCLHLLDADKASPTDKLGAIIEFPDGDNDDGGKTSEIKKIGLCKNHYQKYLDGKEIYHYFKQRVVKSSKHKVIAFP
jgi:hypothetical protein